MRSLAYSFPASIVAGTVACIIMILKTNFGAYPRWFNALIVLVSTAALWSFWWRCLLTAEMRATIHRKLRLPTSAPRYFLIVLLGGMAGYAVGLLIYAYMRAGDPDVDWMTIGTMGGALLALTAGSATAIKVINHLGGR
jgi:hypothetical protein